MTIEDGGRFHNKPALNQESELPDSGGDGKLVDRNELVAPKSPSVAGPLTRRSAFALGHADSPVFGDQWTPDEREFIFSIAAQLPAVDTGLYGIPDPRDSLGEGLARSAFRRNVRTATQIAYFLRDNPELRQYIHDTSSLRLMAGMQTNEFLQAVAGLGEVNADGDTLMALAAEMVGEQEWLFRSGQMVMDFNDGRRRQTDLLTQSDLVRVAENAEVGIIGELDAPGTAWTDVSTGAELVSQLRQRAVDEQSISWAASDNRLTLAIPDGEGSVLYDLELDDGAVIESHIDALTAIVLALNGKAHRLIEGGVVDSGWNLFVLVGKVINAIGTGLEYGWGYATYAVGQAENLLLDDDQEVNVSLPQNRRNRRRDEQAAVIRDRVANNADSYLSLVALAAQDVYEEALNNQGQMIADVGTWALSPEAQAAGQMLADDLSSSEFDEQWRNLVPGDESALKHAVDATLGTVLDAFEWYNSAVLYFGTHLIDAFGDTAQGIRALFDMGDEGGPENFVDAFASTWDWTEAQTPSEYWGFEGSDAEWLDLAASFVFDPLIYTGASAATKRKHLAELIRTPEGVEQVLQMPVIRRQAFNVFKYSQAEEAGSLRRVAALTKGMKGQHRIEALTRKFASYDEVEDLFRRALPGGGDGGIWLPNFSGHLSVRNTALQVERLLGVGDSEFRRWFATHLGTFGRGRTVSVAPTSFMDEATDLLIEMWVHNPERADLGLQKMIDAWNLRFAEPDAALAAAKVQTQVWGDAIATLNREFPAEFKGLLERAYGRSFPEDELASKFESLLDEITSADSRLQAIAVERQMAATQAPEVVDAAPGLPPLYHGSRGGSTKVVPYTGRSAENLYGPGLYTTTDETVATSYGKGNPPQAVKWTGDAPPRILDGDAAIPDAFRARVRQLAESLDVPSDDFTEFLTLIDDAATSTQEAITSFRRLLRQANDITTTEASEYVGDAVFALRNDYDAVKYAGGQAGGAKGHDIYVWLSEESVQFARNPRMAALDAEEAFVRGGGFAEQQALDAERRTIRNIKPAKRTTEQRNRLVEINKRRKELRSGEAQGAKDVTTGERAFLGEVGPRFREFDTVDGVVGSLTDDYAEWMAKYKQARKARENARLLEASVGTRSNDALARWFAEAIDDFGRTPLDEGGLGLSEWVGKTGETKPNLYLPDRNALDWSEVTGIDHVFHSADDVDTIWRLRDPATGELLNEKAARDVYEAGLFRRQSYFPMPASPHQMNAYRVAQTSGWSKKAWEEFIALSTHSPKFAKAVTGTASAAAKAVSGFFGLTSRLFATILWNPRVAWRSEIDEDFRMIKEGYLRGGRPAASIDRATGELVPVAKPVQGPVRRALWPWGKQREFEGYSGMLYRQMLDPAGSPGGRGVEWAWVDGTVKKNRPAHRRAVIRQVENTWSEPGFQAYAQVVRDTADDLGISIPEAVRLISQEPGAGKTAAFSEFWEREGSRIAKTTAWNPVDGRMVSENTADLLRAQANMTLIVGGKENADEIIEFLITGAQGGRVTRAHEATIRKFGPVPTDEAIASHGVWAADKIQNAADYIFHGMYGVPGANRGGAFHARKFGDTLESLTVAHQNAGTLLTYERMAQRLYGQVTERTVDDAARWMATHPTEVENLLAHTHMVTPTMLEAQANRVATDFVMNLMYQPGASSLMGAKIQRYLSPFGPAQWDWVGYWTQRATDAATIGLFGKQMQVPNFLAFSRMLKGEPLGALPFNQRLFAEFAELGANLRKIGPDEDQTMDRSFLESLLTLGPDDVLNELTFFPDVTSTESFLVDFGPSIGPVQSWLLRLPEEYWDDIPVLREIMEVMEPIATDLQPALEWDTATLSKDSLLNALFPNYEGSPRSMASALWRAGLYRLGGEPSARPPDFWSYYKADAALGLRDLQEQGTILAWTDNKILQWIDDLDSNAESKAFDAESHRIIKKAFPFGRRFISPNEPPMEIYRGFVDSIDLLSDLGMIGDAQADKLRELWAKWEDDTITEDEARLLEDTAGTAFRGLRDLLPEDGRPISGDIVQSIIVAQHWELAMGLEATYECARNSRREFAEGAACTLDGKVQGGLTREEFVEGLENGWYVERDPREYISDVMYRVANARMDVARYVFGAYFEDIGQPRSRFDPASLPSWFMDSDHRVEPPPELVEFMRILDPNVKESMTPEEFQTFFTNQTKTWGRLRRELPGSGFASADPHFDDVLALLERVTDREVEDGYTDDFTDWPSDIQDLVRQLWNDTLVGVADFDMDDYNRHFSGRWGPLDFSFDPPPPLDSPEIEQSWTVTDMSDIEVIDGDTIKLYFADGGSRLFRLMGVNAPDQPMPGWEDGFNDLYDIIRHEANRVDLVVWRSEQYGLEAGDDYLTGQPRYKVWLYVNGYPVYTPEVFTFKNPRGIGSGGSYRPLPRPWGEVGEEVA